MSRNLYLTSKVLYDKTNFTNLASIKYSTLLIQNVTWWTIYPPTNHISVITNNSELHIYKLQDEKSPFQEIWTGVFSQFVPSYFQVHENILQDKIFLFLSATTDDLDLFAVKPSASEPFYTKFAFRDSIQISQIKALNFDSLILISIPKLWLILFDTIDFSTRLITKSEALNFETPQLLLNCSSRPDLFFSVESLGFYELVSPLNMMSLLPEQRLIGAHFIASHQLTQNLKETIKQASTKLNPYEFYEFLLEFIISATWHELANKCLEYSQKRETKKNGLNSIAQFYLDYYPHSLHQIHSIIHEKVSSNTIRFENVEEEELSLAVEASAKRFHNQTLTKINNDYVPDKFWKRATILKALIHLLIQKPKKNELPFCEYPLLVNYNNTHEESKSKQLKIHYNYQSIFTFLCDLNEIECKIFNQIEGRSLQSPPSFFLFSIHYFLSKRFHFPFFTKNCLLSPEQSSEIQSFSKTMQQFLFKLRFFTVDVSYENNPYYQMQLWLNSPLCQYSQKKLDNLPSSFVYKWPNLRPSNKRTPFLKSSDSVFGPFLKYKNDLLRSQIEFPQKILLDREKDYTFEKLLELYS